MKLHPPAVGTVLGAAALMVSLGGVALATIPSSNGQIEGCYDPSGAKPPYALSVVDNPADCASPAVLLPFNQRGPAGPPGASGSGTPPAASVGSAQLQDGAVTRQKIAPGALGQTSLTLNSGLTSTRTVRLRPGAAALIDGVQQRLQQRGDTAYNFTLSLRNPGSRPVTVTARVLLNNRPEEGSFSQTLPPRGDGSLAGVLKCNGMSAGRYRVALRLTSSGGRAVVRTSTLLVQSEVQVTEP